MDARAHSGYSGARTRYSLARSAGVSPRGSMTPAISRGSSAAATDRFRRVWRRSRERGRRISPNSRVAPYRSEPALAGLVFVGLAVIVGLPVVAISLIRIRRAGEHVRASLQQAGYNVVRL